MGFVKKWMDKIARYVDIKISLLKLELIEIISGVFSTLVFVLIAFFIGFCVLLFFGLTLSEWFFSITDSRILAYLITTFVYLLLFILLLAIRKKITGFFSGIFIGILTEADEEEPKISDSK